MDILPEDAPAPRLCHLIKWPDFDGYGFNLHAERTNPGQYIGKIDDDSPAQMAGLREGDRIVEVNGVNIANENHRQVVERIKSDPLQTRLLVLDPEADSWYRERDQVVKSSQLNVVYMKTPTPRPPSDSPDAKFHQQQVSAGEESLQTSDFNEQDSIEQPAAKQTTGGKSRTSPPMSPDSGKGDEEPTAVPAVIEAEINHQAAPMKHQDQEQQDEDATGSSGSSSSSSSSSASNIIEPDSLSQTGASMSPSPAATTTQMSQSEATGFETRGGSADSGQSSSPDSSSSRGSIVDDSLEERQVVVESLSSPVAAAPTRDGKVAGADLDAEDAQTIKNYQAAEDAAKSSRRNNEEDISSDPLKATGVEHFTEQQQVVSGEKLQVTPDVEDAEQPKLKSALSNRNSSINNNNNDISSNNNNDETQQVHSNTKAELHETTTTAQQQKQTLSTKNGLSNNYSGLNLNMTASEMRELIARRKKFDPKKAQMNIRQKYEIIQQM